MSRGLGALPERMRVEQVEKSLELLKKKRAYLFVKRVFDIAASLVLIVLTSPLLIGLAAAVKACSEGPVFYRQERVTKNMRRFRIFKFRSMIDKADEKGPLVTVEGDARITPVGRFMRGTRLDELPQLFNVLAGDMSFVGTRPEVPKYVERYSDDMLPTLLMRAGITSRASIAFMDEAELLDGADDPDETYVREILPRKMKYNLEYIKKASVREDLSVLLATVAAMVE